MAYESNTSFHSFLIMAYPGYQQTTVTTYVSVPQTWNRVHYSYPSHYDRRSNFIMPMGVDPATAALFQQASAMFRSFDTNWSGTLDKKEWKKAMKRMGYYMAKHDKERLFRIVDTDRSGRISEREFCEYWVYSRGLGGGGGSPYGAPHMQGGYGAPMHGGMHGGMQGGMPGGMPGYGAPPMGNPGYGAPPMGGNPGYGAPPMGGNPGYGGNAPYGNPAYGQPQMGGPPPYY